MCQRKACPDLEHCLSATYGIRARPAPNLQDRKSLNFQEKIERKSKVSKLNDVETVETVEGADATRNGYDEREAVTLDQHIGIRSIQRHCDHGLKTAMHAEPVQNTTIRKKMSCRAKRRTCMRQWWYRAEAIDRIARRP
jgi:hypothetical protein